MVQTLFCTDTAIHGTDEFCVADTPHCGNKYGLKIMLVFLDCEFTDFIDCELISLAMVSEDGQVENRVEAFKVRRCDVADVLSDRRDCRHIFAKRAIAEIIRIETADLVAKFCQHRHQDSADVAFIARN